MRLLTLYKPKLLRPTFLILRSYHSAEYNGGGLIGLDNIPVNPPKGPDHPLSHLESTHITNPRTVSIMLKMARHFFLTRLIDC